MARNTTRKQKVTFTELLSEASTWQDVMSLRPTSHLRLQFEPGDSWLLESAPGYLFGVFDPYADEHDDDDYETMWDIIESTLTPTELEVFRLRVDQDLSFSLIGLELDTSKQAAHATFGRAQSKLQEVFGGYDG